MSDMGNDEMSEDFSEPTMAEGFEPPTMALDALAEEQAKVARLSPSWLPSRDGTRALTDEQLTVLMGALNPARIARRSQGGRNLSYLEGYDIRATLIRVFGFGGFSADVIDTQIMEITKTEMPGRNGGDPYTRITACAVVTFRLTIHQLGVTFTESAAASQTGRDIGEVLDFAIKTAETDAMKRCATNLGTQFGLSLYNNGSTNEVVRRIFAPGQEWPREEEQPSEEKQAALREGLGQRDA